MSTIDERWVWLMEAGERARRDPHNLCSHKRYKMTCAEYDQLAAAQGGACAVCCRVTDEPLQVDHDHAIGLWAVRGLVCHYCNTSRLMKVDAGRVEPSPAIRKYLAEPWHATHRRLTYN